MILATCKAGDTAIDVGANYGAHTYSMLQRVGHRGRVFAFEPNPTIFSRLATWRQRFPQFRPMPIALSDHAGKGTLSVPRAGAGFGTLRSCASDNVQVTFEVEVDRLDNILEVTSSPHLSLIKVDVEGEEISFLRGALDTICKARPIMPIEISFVRSGERVDDFFSMLDRIGYSVFDFFGERVVRYDDTCWNVLLAPKEALSEAWLLQRCKDVGARFFASFRDWTPYAKLS
jgi:FkbM family methyltransferase